uniref:Uncharacterized protein n=1 Tax=Medicago truncatula TaxID=3880 RepID=I3SAT2_MEDTR|nr:unknown [Medicago truncatula]
MNQIASRKPKHFPSQTIWQRKTPVMSCICSSSVTSCIHLFLHYFSAVQYQKGLEHLLESDKFVGIDRTR